MGGTREAYAYDDAGNVIGMPHLSLMDWDWKDQLQATAQQVLNAGTPGTTYYQYDAWGERVRKVTSSQNGTPVSQRAYLGGYEVYRELSPAGTVTLERQTLHITDGQKRICMVETRTVDTRAGIGTPSTVVRYQLGNHVGSAVLELDEAAAIVSYEEYYPYGSTSFQSGRSAAEVSLKRYRYSGKERDTETGFASHGIRSYIPWLGRWLSPDPCGMVDGSCLYRFSRANPMRYVDPSGSHSRPPAAEPIREGMIIGDYPGLSSRWKGAVGRVLERSYQGGSYEENLRRFEARLQALPRGTNKAPETAINLARETFKRANASFRRMVSLPAGVQVHHSFEGVATDPASALDATKLQITRGQAVDPSSTHYRAHQTERLAARGVRNPGVAATQAMEASRAAGTPATQPASSASSPVSEPLVPGRALGRVEAAAKRMLSGVKSLALTLAIGWAAGLRERHFERERAILTSSAQPSDEDVGFMERGGYSYAPGSGGPQWTYRPTVMRTIDRVGGMLIVMFGDPTYFAASAEPRPSQYVRPE